MYPVTILQHDILSQSEPKAFLGVAISLLYIALTFLHPLSYLQEESLPYNVAYDIP
jgi:hypothetical protein